MLTTIDVVVGELCTDTVARIPTIRSATGLLRILLDAKASPAAFSPSNRKALLRKSKEQMKKYRIPRNRMTLPENKATRLTFSKPFSSGKTQKSRSYLVQTMLNTGI